MRPPVLSVLLLAAASSYATDLQSLFDRKQLFDLRDAVQGAEAPPFFRAAVACSFQDEDRCLAESKAFLNSNPPKDLAIKMHEVLFGFNLARGRWSEALADMETEVALGGESEDPNHAREMCRAFLRHGPVSVDRSAYSRIHVLHKNAHVPITVNGRRYRGYLDTGANLSMISESAAKQLGLSIETAGFRFFGASGKGLPSTRIAVAERLAIGNVELRNVPFVVIGDRQEPFVSWGSGKRCILGIQVFLAAATLRGRAGYSAPRWNLPGRPASAMFETRTSASIAQLPS